MAGTHWLICEKTSNELSLDKDFFEYDCKENGDDNSQITSFRIDVPSTIYYSEINSKWYIIEDQEYSKVWMREQSGSYSDIIGVQNRVDSHQICPNMGPAADWDLEVYSTFTAFDTECLQYEDSKYP